MPAADPPVTDAAPDEGAPPRPSPPPPPPRPLSLASALPFWFYLAAAVSLLALLLPHILPPSSSPAPLPPLLRGHLAAGRVLKLDPAPGLFAVTSHPAGIGGGGSPAHRVLVLPGLAAGSLSFRRVLSSLSSRGVHATALEEIMNRGIFHAFEHLVQIGEVPY